MRKRINLLRCVFIFFLLLSFLQTFSQSKKDMDADSAFSKVEIEASFPGGEPAWNKYVSNAMKNEDFSKYKKSDQGTCRIRFIVDKQGRAGSVEAINMKKSRLAKLGIEIISNSPKWKPAQQDGKFVKAYHEQPITLTLTN